MARLHFNKGRFSKGYSHQSCPRCHSHLTRKRGKQLVCTHCGADYGNLYSLHQHNQIRKIEQLMRLAKNRKYAEIFLLFNK